MHLQLALGPTTPVGLFAGGVDDHGGCLGGLAG